MAKSIPWIYEFRTIISNIWEHLVPRIDTRSWLPVTDKYHFLIQCWCHSSNQSLYTAFHKVSNQQGYHSWFHNIYCVSPGPINIIIGLCCLITCPVSSSFGQMVGFIYRRDCLWSWIKPFCRVMQIGRSSVMGILL